MKESTLTEDLQREKNFKLMVAGLLSEIQYDQTQEATVADWLTEFLTRTNGFKEKELEFRQWKDLLPIPTTLTGEISVGTFLWKQPEEINVIGSWIHKTALRNLSAVDLRVVIPRDCLNKSDLLNHKYHAKRAWYLAYLFKKLKSCGYKDLQYSWPDGNPLKPALDITIAENLKARLHIVPSPDLFKQSRLSPDKNNSRYNKFYKDSLLTGDSDLECTPHYNVSISQDIFLHSTDEILENTINSNSLRETVVLLKIWLRNRSLNHGYGSFSNTMLALYLSYLIKKGEIDPSMSTFQVLKNFLVQLSNSEWDKNGIGFLEDSSKSEAWQKVTDVVFIDSSGLLNYTCQMSKHTYNRVKSEARKASAGLADFTLLCFQSLFVEHPLFLHMFDHVLQVKEKDIEEEIGSREDQKWNILNHSGYLYPVAVSIITQLVEKCFRGRLQFVDAEPSSIASWNGKGRPEYEQRSNVLRFGINVNPEESKKQVEKCGSETPEAISAFKEFWGEISELRRFKDGSISEAVIFAQNKDRVCYELLKYTLKRHLKVDLEKDLTSYLDSQIILNFEPEYTLIKSNGAESRNKKRKLSAGGPDITPQKQTADDILDEVCNGFDKLSKMLRQLKGLPLAITTVQGISPALRYTSPFPTPPQKFFASDMLVQRHPRVNTSVILRAPGGKRKVTTDGLNKTVQFVEPISLVIQLETTGKWPDDLDAIERLKSALLVNVGQSLASQFGIITQATSQYLDVYMDGIVYRVRLFYRRQLMLLKEIKEASGILKTKENAEVLHLEKEGIHLPQITTTLLALRHQHLCFGKACRLAKRWLASHLLLSPPFTFSTPFNHTNTFTQEAVELLVASVFVNHRPFLHPPHEAQTAFLRFLDLLATTDWNVFPLIVNFNETFTPNVLQNIEREFSRNRRMHPALFISTPHDQLESVWTKDLSKVVLKRAASLADTARKYIHVVLTTGYSSVKDFRDACSKMFSTSLDNFHVIIWLKKNMNARRHQNIGDFPVSKIRCTHYYKSKDEFLPVVDFDPVERYIQELRDCFGHLAIFLNDFYGGNCIGVAWKADSLKPKDFSVTSVKCRCLDESHGKLQVDFEAVIESFQILGAGLVDRVEFRSDSSKS